MPTALSKIGLFILFALPLVFIAHANAQQHNGPTPVAAPMEAAPLSAPEDTMDEPGMARQEIREEMQRIRTEHEELESEHDQLRTQCLNAKGQDRTACHQKWEALNEQGEALHERMKVLHDKIEAAREEHRGHGGEHHAMNNGEATQPIPGGQQAPLPPNAQ